jgi:hypothetical protein
MAFALIGIIMLVALMIPIFGILVDSPIGRAIARRLEGPEQTIPANLSDLARKVELLEAEVDDLTSAVESLKEENQFFQKLLEDQASRPSLPPKTP